MTQTPTPDAAATPRPNDAAADTNADAVEQTAAIVGNPEFVADTMREYLTASWKRIRGGESGVLPVLAGLVLIIVIFQLKNSEFLTAGNITNLLIQSVTYILLGMAEVFVLLLGEIDLSIGYFAAVGAVTTVALTQPNSNWPWWAAVIAGMLVTSAFGAIQGLMITLLRIPSFVVTLGGLLGAEGLLLFLAQREGGPTGGGTISVTNNTIYDLVNGNLSTTAGWVVTIVIILAYAALMLVRERTRRARNLAGAPFALTLVKIFAFAVAGVLLVLVCNANRGRGFVALQGIPWVIPIVLGVVVIWSFLLGRTKPGRYIYAIGGNAEAARRSGISLTRIRILAFTLAGLTSGLAGILYASRLGSISNNVDGGQLVLYAVAAAVIGGTSLVGGRGKMIHALLGGLVVTTIYNGMGLIGLSAAAQDMVIALVLLAAVTVDSLARRGRSTA